MSVESRRRGAERCAIAAQIPVVVAENEEWRVVPDYPSYEVSSEGRMRSSESGRVLKPYLAGDIYFRIRLHQGGSTKDARVHALVALAFRGPRPEGMQIRHLNGDSIDNRASNLAYGTPAQNRADTIEHGADGNLNKTHCPHGHEYTEANTYYSDYGRACKKCRKGRKQKLWEARRDAADRSPVAGGTPWFAGLVCDHIYADCPSRMRGEKTLRDCGWWDVGGQGLDPFGTDVCGICRHRFEVKR